MSDVCSTPCSPVGRHYESPSLSMEQIGTYKIVNKVVDVYHPQFDDLFLYRFHFCPFSLNQSLKLIFHFLVYSYLTTQSQVVTSIAFMLHSTIEKQKLTPHGLANKHARYRGQESHACLSGVSFVTNFNTPEQKSQLGY